MAGNADEQVSAGMRTVAALTGQKIMSQIRSFRSLINVLSPKSVLNNLV